MKLICNVTRGGHIESRHEVYAVVLDEDGRVIFSSGDPNLITCVRSSLKPFQASAAIKAGATSAAKFTSEEIALMCGSHSGEEIHVNTGKGMAEKLGFDITQYECGSHPPYDSGARSQAQQTGFTPFHNNCSGKHSGMLALAKHLGENPQGYIDDNHPVQAAIFKQLRILTKKDKFPYGIDGCSAPTPFMSLTEIARLFKALGSGKIPELNTAYEAMTAHPYLVGGKDRFDTDFNTALKGRGVTKVGGEAIRGMVIKTEKYGVVGIAQKIIDGNQRANETAIMAILKHLELLSEEEYTSLKNYETKALYNHCKIHIGDVKAELS